MAARRYRIAIGGAASAWVLALAALAAPAASSAATCPPLTIASPSTLPDVQELTPYSYQLTTSATTCALSWSETGLPPTIRLTNGVLTGNYESGGRPVAPPGPQTISFVATVTDGTNRVSKQLSLPVVDTIQVTAATSGASAELAAATVAPANPSRIFIAGPGSNGDYGLAAPALTEFPSPGTPFLGLLDFPDAVTAGLNGSGGETLVTANEFGASTLEISQFTGGSNSRATTTALRVPGCTTPVGVANDFSSVRSGVQMIVVTCPGSNSVDSALLVPSGPPVITADALGAGALPSGVAFIGHYAHSFISSQTATDYAVFLIADAANDTVSLIGFADAGRVSGVTPLLLGQTALPAGSRPANIAWDAVNDTAYVADAGLNAVSQIGISGIGASTADAPVVVSEDGEFAVGKAPYALAYADGSLVVANSGDNDASVISVSRAPELLNTPTVGATPSGVTIGEYSSMVSGQPPYLDAFVTSEIDGTVTAIDPPAARSGTLLTVKHLSRARRHRRPHAAAAASADPLLPPLPSAFQ